MGNAESVNVCFRCGKHKGSKKLDAGLTLAGKIATASGAEPPVDKRAAKEAKKAGRLAAKLAAKEESDSDSDSDSDGDDDDGSSSSDGEDAAPSSSKKRKAAAADSSDSSGDDDDDSSDSDSSSSDDDDEKEGGANKTDIGFMGTGRDTAGDWTCPRCSNLNWNNRDKCNRCPQLKGEKPPPTPAELKAAKEAALKAK